jgi:hypothetical protein
MIKNKITIKLLGDNQLIKHITISKPSKDPR